MGIPDLDTIPLNNHMHKSEAKTQTRSRIYGGGELELTIAHIGPVSGENHFIRKGCHPPNAELQENLIIL